jgi:hypothetical protein
VPLRDIIDFGRPSPPSPGIPGTNNWVPIGPSVLRRGQPAGRPAISGRAGGIAVGGPRNQRVYVATADGGVWRSDDAGAHWYSTMDNFDRDPTTLSVTSLACGAIAIDELNPDRVYVGTGEGDTDSLFAVRRLAALPSYRGIGPLRSDDGGANWLPEPTASGSPTLEGAAFYQLAVDPGDRERVVAATTNGLYRREPDGAGGYARDGGEAAGSSPARSSRLDRPPGQGGYGATRDRVRKRGHRRERRQAARPHGERAPGAPTRRAGLHQPQIADTLFISRKTAAAHVSNILSKLGVARRVQAAAMAERLDLLYEPKPQVTT